MKARSPAAWLSSALALACTATSCFIDPVHDNDVSALGPEEPNVSTGPDHRPGQPCLVCHGGSGPATAQFSIAGTIYDTQGQKKPSQGAAVTMVDNNGSMSPMTVTNRVGNFYIELGAWAPNNPIHSVTVTSGNNSSQMLTHIGRDGSCAGCHFNPPGPMTPGPVYVNPSQ